jgi:hypothetical protein
LKKNFSAGTTPVPPLYAEGRHADSPSKQRVAHRSSTVGHFDRNRTTFFSIACFSIILMAGAPAMTHLNTHPIAASNMAL